MLASLAELHHYVLPSDRQTLDQIEIRAAEAKMREVEQAVRGCMARTPKDDEPRRSRRPVHDRMRVEG